MAFTELEMSILAQLAYRDIDYKEAAEEPLYEVLKTNRDWLVSGLGPTYEKYVDNLMNKVEGQNYVIAGSEHDKLSGFAAFAVSTPENDVVVASRGTQMSKINDLLTDGGLAMAVETQQHRDMEKFVNRLEKRGYDGFYFTGHSLGGNLATHGAVTVDDPSKVRGVYTYNAPGFNETYWSLHGDRLRALRFCIVNYQNEYDYVSSILRVPGKVIIIESSVATGHLGFDDHSINAFTIDENGSFVPNASGRKHPQTYAGTVAGEAGQLIGFGPYSGLFRLYNMYQDFKYRETCRDFSQDAKQMLVGAAKETEEEKWWEVTKWDCWYKVDQFFGVLEWDLYTGNVDKYYRKLIDINDASVADIERIFEKVYEIDSSYSAKISAASDSLRSNVLNKLSSLRDSVVVD